MAASNLALPEAGLLTEASHAVPMLAKRLADTLEKAGLDPRDIFSQTGWFRDTDNVWNYAQGDAKMRLTEPGDNPRLSMPTYRQIAQVEQAPKTYMKTEPELGIGAGERFPMYLTRSGSIKDVHPDNPSQMVFRSPKASELFNHPMMFEGTPEIADVPVDARFEPDSSRFGGGYIPGQFTPHGKPEFQLTAPKPGQADPEGHDILSVARHEIAGHGLQGVYDRPMGANVKAPGITDTGIEIAKRAREGQQRLEDSYREIIQRRLDSGMSYSDAVKDLQQIAFSDWRPKYHPWTDVNSMTAARPQYEANSFDWLGYKGFHGEAMARNAQTRGEIDQTLPMTGDRGGYWTQGGQWVDVPDYNPPGPREADLHPFETLDIPPDLLFQQPQGWDPTKHVSTGGGSFPPQGAFDWLFMPKGVSRSGG